ncbi:geranylgeranyl pyrophosphate synthase-like isoform X2 [Zerene cesonia]|nr:geranylgeranyl pyrophosphate synthase-like isoform X2 [Zerene cesonia]
MRRGIAEAFNHWMKISDEKMNEVLEIVNMYHNASLLADDIQDGDTIRRGIPAAHCVFGVPMTMNASVHVIMLAMKRCGKYHPKGIEIINEQSLELVRGQGKEIYWRDMFVCPTEEEYMEMLRQKTGEMFNLAARLMQLWSSNTKDYRAFGRKLGMYFQLRDDYCNIAQPEKLEERPSDQILNDYYMDLTEGKFTLPIIHAARSLKGASVLSILKQRTKDINLKRYCVSLLEDLGSMEYTRKVLRDLDREIREEIARLGGNPAMLSVMDQLLTWEQTSR